MKAKKKGRYEVCWYEYHNPINYTDSEESDKFDTYQNKTPTLLKQGIKRILQLYPECVSWRFDPAERDGWIEMDCRVYADTLDKAIKKADDYAMGNGVDVFSIIDRNTGKTVFTEEELDEYYEKETLSEC